MTTKLICITGADGAGKTTQITRVAEQLIRQGTKGLAVATIWDLMLDPETAPKIGVRSPADVDRLLGVLHPPARTLYFYLSFREVLTRALARGPQVILLNSYWYKYCATEIAHGADPGQSERLAEEIFPEPDLTFYLRVDPRDAFARKANLSSYETGFADPKTEAKFVDFQRRAQAFLEAQCEKRAWIGLEASEPREAVTARILERL